MQPTGPDRGGATTMEPTEHQDADTDMQPTGPDERTRTGMQPTGPDERVRTDMDPAGSAGTGPPDR